MEVSQASRDDEAGASVEGPVVDDGVRPADVIAMAFAIFLAGVLFAAYCRYLELSRPGVLTRSGFYGVSAHGQPDQFYYLRTARVLAGWHAPRGTGQYRYGLGYPILAVPFIWLGLHSDPFAPVDALAFGGALALTFVLGTRLSPFRSRTSTLAFGMAAAAVVGLSSPLGGVASVPWNSNIVVPLGLFVLVVATAKDKVTVSRTIAVGVAIGWIFAIRYLDAFFLGLPIVVMVVRSTPAQRRRVVIGGGTALAVMVVLVLASQQYAFGNFLTTPYHFHTRAAGTTNDQSISEYRPSSIPKHFIGGFITGKDDHGVRQPRDPILRDFPLLVFMPVGAYILWRRRFDTRAVWLSAIAGSALGSLFYLSFVAGGGGDLKFGNAHYWAPWYPLWSILAIVGLTAIATRIISANHRHAPL